MNNNRHPDNPKQQLYFENGAHFSYKDLYNKLKNISKERESELISNQYILNSKIFDKKETKASTKVINSIKLNIINNNDIQYLITNPSERTGSKKKTITNPPKRGLILPNIADKTRNTKITSNYNSIGSNSSLKGTYSLSTKNSKASI
jgi:hypothetical protein